MCKCVLLMVMVIVAGWGSLAAVAYYGRPTDGWGMRVVEVMAQTDPRLNQCYCFATLASLLRGEHGQIRVMDQKTGVAQVTVDDSWLMLTGKEVNFVEPLLVEESQVALVPPGRRAAVILTPWGQMMYNEYVFSQQTGIIFKQERD